eukprot:gene1429-15851_t
MPEDGGGPADGGAKPTLTEFKISVDSLLIEMAHEYMAKQRDQSQTMVLLKQLQHNLLETGDKVEQQQSAHRDTAARPEF